MALAPIAHLWPAAPRLARAMHMHTNGRKTRVREAVARPRPCIAYPVAKRSSSGSLGSSEKCSGKMAVRHGRREAAASTVLSARARRLTLPGMRANSFISSIAAAKSVTNIQTYPFWR